MMDAKDQARFAKHKATCTQSGKAFEDTFNITLGDGKKRAITLSMSAKINPEDRVVSNFHGSITVQDRA